MRGNIEEIESNLLPFVFRVAGLMLKVVGVVDVLDGVPSGHSNSLMRSQ